MTGLYIPSMIAPESLSLWIRASMIGTIVAVVVWLELLQSLLEFVLEKWRQRKVLKQMKRLGYSGPSIGLFSNNRKEMTELRMKAPKDPLYSSAGLNHDFLQRVLAPHHAWRNLYGNTFIFASDISSKITMYTTDADVAKEILSLNVLEYRIHRTAVGAKLFGSKGILCSSGEEWLRQRKVVRPAFYLGRAKGLVKEMASWIDLWLRKLEKTVADHENEGSVEIEMVVEFNEIAQDILARSSFGSSFEKGRKVFQHQEKHRHLLFQQLMVSSTLSRWTGGQTTLKEAMRKEEGEVLKGLREIIRERRNSIQPENVQSYGDDLLGLLLADRDRRLAADGRAPGELETEDEHLTDQCRSFFVAGADTVQYCLSWAAVLLGHYTDWQERIRVEVQDAFQGAPPNGDQLMKLRQLDMFVQETLRLYGTGLSTTREVVGPNTSLCGQLLPQNLLIMINFLGVNRETEYWGEDALQFRPERFADGILQACKKPSAFESFGFGPRSCVAQTLAVMEVKLVLALLVQRFSFRLAPGYRHEPVFTIVVVPKFGVQLIMERIPPAK